MEQGRRDEPCQQEQARTPLRCPRCDSLDTRFRYFNNQNPAQPRHYCKNCKRTWTEGGNLRNIPFGGKCRNNKQRKASSSQSGDASIQSPQPTMPSRQEIQISHYLRPMVSMTLRDTSVTTAQTIINQPATVSSLSSCYLNDEISCLDVIQSLIQPQVSNRDRIPSTTPQQVLLPQISRHTETYQANNAAPHHLSNNILVPPPGPMNFFRQGVSNTLSFSTSDASFGNNSGGNTIDHEMDASMDVDQWFDFSGYCDNK